MLYAIKRGYLGLGICVLQGPPLFKGYKKMHEKPDILQGLIQLKDILGMLFLLLFPFPIPI